MQTAEGSLAGRDLVEVYAQEHRDARLIPDDADV
jgi:hypothetical protein